MAEVWVDRDEWWPVYSIRRERPGFMAAADTVEIPDELIERLERTAEAFAQANEEVGRLYKAAMRSKHG